MRSDKGERRNSVVLAIVWMEITGKRCGGEQEGDEMSV